jgi:hypothetical protein
LTKISPSAYEKWKKCPAYSHLIEYAPREQSIYAKEGTEDHRIAQMILESKNEINPNMFVSSKKRLACIKDYVDYVRCIEQESNCKCKCEVTFQFYICGQQLKGTADCIIYNKKESLLHVIDLKTGTGVSVDAFENGQLLLYAVGISILLKSQKIEPQNFRLTIVQPNDFRSEHIRHWDLTREEMLDKFNGLQSIIKYNIFHQNEYYPGSHCTMCNCITICPILQTEIKTIQTEKQIGTISREEKARILEMKPRIYKFLKEIEIAIIKEINEGKEIPGNYGMKWIKGTNKRYIINEKELLKKLIEDGYMTELLAMPTFKWLQDNLGKEELENWTEKRESPPRLVSLDTKGEEIENTDDIAKRF